MVHIATQKTRAGRPELFVKWSQTIGSASKKAPYPLPTRSELLPSTWWGSQVRVVVVVVEPEPRQSLITGLSKPVKVAHRLARNETGGEYGSKK